MTYCPLRRWIQSGRAKDRLNCSPRSGNRFRCTCRSKLIKQASLLSPDAESLLAIHQISPNRIYQLRHQTHRKPDGSSSLCCNSRKEERRRPDPSPYRTGCWQHRPRRGRALSAYSWLRPSRSCGGRQSGGEDGARLLERIQYPHV